MAENNRMARRGFLAASLAAMAAPNRLLAQTGDATIRLACSFADQDFTVRLEDNPTVQDLLSLLPIEATIEDYSTNEKIAYLPRKLSDAGSGPFANEAAGDVCYFAPWGNLAFFYKGYRYSNGLIRLGRLEGGVEPLLQRGKYPLRIEAIA
jgi:hypothetical protein